MKLVTLFAVLILAVLPAAAQDFEMDTNTPEGRLLQQIGFEEDAQRKILLLEQFVKEHPNHGGIGWVYGQMPVLYAELNQPDKALAAGERMLAAKPTDAAGAHACLKIAEAQKDPDLIRQWAVNTFEAAKKAVEAPKPEFEFEDEEEAWNEAVEFAKQVSTYSEYALYAAALQATDPAKVVELGDALKELNAESQYLPRLNDQYFRSYLVLGETEKAVAVAEEILATDPANEDVLLVVADACMGNKELDKALSYAARVIEVMNAKAAPEGVSPEDWEKKKKDSLGQAHWMTGMIYGNQRKYSQTNKALRQALPYIEDNEEMLAGALFHLGVANFQMGDAGGNQKLILAGFNYTKQCAAIKSPFQAQARKNLKGIQTKYRIR